MSSGTNDGGELDEQGSLPAPARSAVGRVRTETCAATTPAPNGHLTGDADRIAVPADVTNGLTDFTMATWVNLAVADARIFDFGRPGDSAARLV